MTKSKPKLALFLNSFIGQLPRSDLRSDLGCID